MRPLAVLLLMSSLLSCASGPLPAGDSAVTNYGRENGRVWVRGPWDAITPSTNMDDVIDQLCPAVMALPGARDGDYGREYCGVIYTLGDGIYYSSFPSPLGPTVLNGHSKRKQCHAPALVKDPRGNPDPEADYHNHPWPGSRLSEQDQQSSRQYLQFRIQFDTRCTIQKLVPNLGSSRPGEVYERRGKSWVLIGIIKPEDKPYGYLTPIGNQ
jgi:hypothetical protein